jgi:hypothetical protein
MNISTQVWENILDFLDPKYIEMIRLVSHNFSDFNQHPQVILSKDTDNIGDIGVFWAAKNCNLKVLKWLYSHYSVVNDATVHSMVYAVQSDTKKSLEVLKWLQTKLSINTDSFDCRSVFIETAKRGNLRVLKYLYSHPINGHEITKNDICFFYNVLGYVFEYGYFNVLKWICSTYKLLRSDINVNHVFYGVASSGKLKMLKWLHSRLSFTEIEARCLNCCAIKRAATKGHLKVLKWLHKTFNFTPEDVRNEGNTAIKEAVKENHFHTFKWLVSTFNLTEADIRSENNYIIKTASSRCNLKLLQWLYAGSFLAEKDIDVMTHGCIFTFSHSHEEKIEILNWIFSTFEWTRKNIKDTCEAMIMSRNYDLIRWLHSAFILTDEEIGVCSDIVLLFADKEVRGWLEANFKRYQSPF